MKKETMTTGDDAVIQYDRKDKKKIEIILLALLALGAILGILFVLCDYHILSTEWDLRSIALIGLWCMPFLLLACVLEYLKCATYLRQLEKNGYTLPENKKEYGGKLSALPNEGGMKQKEYPSHSKILAGITAVVFLGLVGVTIDYYCRWQATVGAFLVVFLIALDLFWLIGAIVYYRQANTAKYRDHTSENDGRKVRQNLLKGIEIIVLSALLSAFLVFWIYMGAEVFRNAGRHAAIEQDSVAVAGEAGVFADA